MRRLRAPLLWRLRRAVPTAPGDAQRWETGYRAGKNLRGSGRRKRPTRTNSQELKLRVNPPTHSQRTRYGGGGVPRCGAERGTGCSALAPSPPPAFACFISFPPSDLVLPGSGFVASTCEPQWCCSGAEITASFHFSFSAAAAAAKTLPWQLGCKTNPQPSCFPPIFGVGNPGSGAGRLAGLAVPPFLGGRGRDLALLYRPHVQNSRRPRAPRGVCGVSFGIGSTAAGRRRCGASSSLVSGPDGWC